MTQGAPKRRSLALYAPLILRRTLVNKAVKVKTAHGTKGTVRLHQRHNDPADQLNHHGGFDLPVEGFEHNAGIAGDHHEQYASGSLRHTSMSFPVTDGTQ